MSSNLIVIHPSKSFTNENITRIVNSNKCHSENSLDRIYELPKFSLQESYIMMVLDDVL